MHKKEDVIEPIPADFDEVVEKVAKPGTKKPSDTKVLVPPSSRKPGTPVQGRFVGVFIELLEKYAGYNKFELMYNAKSAGVEFNFKGKVI